MKNTEVEIFGSTYTIKGDEDPAYIRQLAMYVDDKMRAVARRSPSMLSTHKIAVLTALNVADELFKLKRRQQDMDDMIREKTGDLFEILEEDKQG